MSLTNEEIKWATVLALTTPYVKKPVEKPKISGYLIFSSTEDFYIFVRGGSANWDGTLEYSTDLNEWTTWDGSNVWSEGGYLYLRGSNNTVINSNFGIATNPGVYCTGNIETILDYKTVANGEHPQMGSYCFKKLFSGVRLLSAPELPATQLSQECYKEMFAHTRITEPPELPATQLSYECYREMFAYTSITEPPELTATQLSYGCYMAMFAACKNLTYAPEIHGIGVRNSYQSMFADCTSLLSGPSKVRIDASGEFASLSCASLMFIRCENLETPPEIEFVGESTGDFAGSWACGGVCYAMFKNCKSLNRLPRLNVKNFRSGCFEEMFSGCSLISVNTNDGPYPYRIPYDPSIIGNNDYYPYSTDEVWGWHMFYETAGTMNDDPVLNTTYYTTNPPI